MYFFCAYILARARVRARRIPKRASRDIKKAPKGDATAGRSAVASGGWTDRMEVLAMETAMEVVVIAVSYSHVNKFSRAVVRQRIA